MQGNNLDKNDNIFHDDLSVSENDVIFYEIDDDNSSYENENSQDDIEVIIDDDIIIKSEEDKSDLLENDLVDEKYKPEIKNLNDKEVTAVRKGKKIEKIDDIALEIDNMTDFQAVEIIKEEEKDKNNNTDIEYDREEEILENINEDIIESDVDQKVILEEIINVNENFTIINYEGFNVEAENDKFIEEIHAENEKYEVINKKSEEITDEHFNENEVEIKNDNDKLDSISNGLDDLKIISSDEIEDDEYQEKFSLSNKIVTANRIENNTDLEMDNLESGDVIKINLNEMIENSEIDEGKILETEQNTEKEIENKSDKEYNSINEDSNNENNLKNVYKDKLIIDLPDDIIDKLPENFDLKPIDLKEAEKIAKEDILLLDEDDLIQELSEIDINVLPAKDELEVVTSEKNEINSENNDSANVDFPKDSFFEELDNVIDNDDEKNDISETETETEIEYLNDQNYDNVEKDFIKDNTESEKAIVINAENENNDENDIIDITERVVIIESNDDVNKFIMNNIDNAKQDNMKKLLSYLDGLFEKLPEDVIKKFADSEYFDLYVKVMNDLGV